MNKKFSFNFPNFQIFILIDVFEILNVCIIFKEAENILRCKLLYN